MNRLWQAVNVINGQRAISLVYAGRGNAVDREYAVHSWSQWAERATSSSRPPRGAYVRMTSGHVRVPRVIQLLQYDRVPRPRVKFTRSNVYFRDQHRCQYCGSTQPASQLTLDHVHPRSRGGPTNWRNIVVSCFGCNARKADRDPDEAGMPLLRQPEAPNWHPTRALRLVEPPHPLWQPFLGAAQR